VITGNRPTVRSIGIASGRMVYLWRAVDAEGEVLDVLVQAKRNKRAALKLMHKSISGPFMPETHGRGSILAFAAVSPLCSRTTGARSSF
jgi:DDE domain